MLQLCFPVNNKKLLIPDKNTSELGNSVNPAGKKLQYSCFWTFYVDKSMLYEGQSIAEFCNTFDLH